MLVISTVLGRCIVEYYEDALKNDRESRLVVPAPTNRIAREIHQVLVDAGITAYLVVGDDVSPDEQKRWIRPIALTSVRVGSFVAITSPGQLAQIQDSIRGSGGTIRSLALPEEWPWIDDGSESFRFSGPILNSLISSWTSDQDEHRWFYKFIIVGLLPCTRSSSFRSTLLLENVLGSFDPLKYPQISDNRLRFLFHAGIPYPTSNIGKPEHVLRRATNVCQAIVSKCRKEDNVRQQAADMIPRILPEQDWDLATHAIHSLLDGVGHGRTLDLGCLAFFSCWENNTSRWTCLSTEVLEQLFEIEEKRPAELRYRLNGDRILVSSSDNILVTFHGEEITIDADFSLPPEELVQFNWSLRLSHRRSTIDSFALTNSSGTHSFLLDTENSFARYKTAIPLKLSLLANDQVRKEARLKLHLCGPDRRAFAVVDEGFDVIDASIQGDDESPDKRLEIDTPTFIYLLSYDLEEPQLKDIDENLLPILSEGKPGIWKSGRRVDPAESSTGQIVRVCQFGDISAVISFEAKDIRKGQFTIEDEIRVQIVGQQTGRLNDLVSIFGGQSVDPYFRLGKIDSAARRRIRLAIDMSNERGWRPLLVNLFDRNLEPGGTVGDYVNFRGTIDTSGFLNLALPAGAIDLLREYSTIRKQILDEIQNSLNAEPGILEHPLYASHPVYVNSRVDHITELLNQYLLAYENLLEYVEGERENLDWEQMFALVYTDCVVHWDDSDLRNMIFLIGPWHPLILVKRFMVQATLYHRALALSNPEGKKFRHLAALLSETAGFRWLRGLHKDDPLIEPIFVIPTSDPGWHFGMKEDVPMLSKRLVFGSTVGILKELKNCIGLESLFVQSHPEALVQSSIVDFTRAFPSRRSISLRVREEYSIDPIVSSVDELLHSEDGPTEHGTALHGGIHVGVEGEVKELPEADWINPQLLVYHLGENSEEFATQTDIYLLAPPRDFDFLPVSQTYAMPRGIGLHSVFCESVRWLTGGQAQLPHTVMLCHDVKTLDTNDLGGMFVSVASRVIEGFRNRLALLYKVDLPKLINSLWAVFPGNNADPAVFVKYVQDGAKREIEERALWDFKFDISATRNTYYILSRIPRGFSVAVDGFFEKENVSSEFIQELGRLGIAIGGEALKSGRRAHGVVGLVGAVRLMAGMGGSGKGAICRSNRCVGFIIPVDSFYSFFSKRSISDADTDGNHKRTDLLIVQLVLPDEHNSSLMISACGVESKFVSQTFSRRQALDALEQAQASNDMFISLVRISQNEWAMPERMALLAIIGFGLRISSVNPPEGKSSWIKIEREVGRCILQGKFAFKAAKCDAVVISTEAQLRGVAELNKSAEGIWIRLNRDHWPGVSESDRLEDIRSELSDIFGVSSICKETPTEKPTPREESQDRIEKVSDEASEMPDAGTKPVPVEVMSTTKEDADGIAEVTKTDAPAEDKTEGPLRKIFIGVDDSRRSVFYDPQSPVDRLDNLNLMITGSSGTGKTQLLKYLICKIREQSKNILVLDFKRDFTDDPIFAQLGSLQPAYISFDGLPFNPLIPYPMLHPSTGELVVQVGQHISGVASVLKRTYRLGPQQQIAVKNAIVDAFASIGLPTTGTSKFDPSMEFPDFNSVGERLEVSDPRAYNRLDPLFTLDLFRHEHRASSFHALVNRSMILDLSQIPSDEIKNTLAELIVLSAHAYYNAQPQSGIIRQFLIFDEAHRVLESDYMASLVRECRAYGVGTILSSQYPTDFPQSISGSVATKILHGNGRDTDRVRTIVQMIGCTGQESDVSDLARFQAFMDNRHSPHTLIRTMNYPLYLIWLHLQKHGEASRAILSSIDGIDVEKLPISDTVNQMERLGLIEERDGVIRLLQYDV